MLKRQYFGTDGLRARVGSSIMSPDFLLKLGYAIGTVLKQSHAAKPSVCIGKDTRISGDMLQSALVTGLLSAGVDVDLLGVMPTPAIGYYAHKHSAAAGIVISASHNPYDDNGIKCIGPDGMKLPDAWELQVEALLQEAITLTAPDQVGVLTVVSSASDEYINHCLKKFSKPLSFKIVVDCANGAACPVALKIFRALDATVVSIHNQPNGININDRCGATDVASLQASVIKEGADCGLAFDGDADRLIMVDHKGEVVDGDEMLGIIAMHGNYQGVAGTVMTNLGLEQALQEKDIAFLRTAVGDRYVLAALLEKGWRLGGEASGHVINLDYSPTGDGIVTGLQVLNIMANSKKTLHELKQVVQKRPQILINVPVNAPKKIIALDDIKNAVEKAQASLGDVGRVLLRASGTQSCVRVMVECDNESQARACAESLVDVVKKFA